MRASDDRPPVTAPWLRVWRLHPHGVRIEPARGNLDGQAPREALRYCGPFTNANRAGFWVHSPVDLDVTYEPACDEPWRLVWPGGGYRDDEVEVLARLLPALHGSEPAQLRPRTKIYGAGAGYEPAHTLQLWTGCVFETPPGWGLWVRSAVNQGYDLPFSIQEGIIDTDWLRVDVALNLRFTLAGLTARLRRDGPPIAQLVPVPRALWAEPTTLEERTPDPDDDEARQVFQEWCDYDREKHFGASGTKDSGVYHRWRRQREVGAGTPRSTT